MLLKRASMVRAQWFQRDNWIGTVFDGYESAFTGLDKLVQECWTDGFQRFGQVTFMDLDEMGFTGTDKNGFVRTWIKWIQGYGFFIGCLVCLLSFQRTVSLRLLRRFLLSPR